MLREQFVLTWKAQRLSVNISCIYLYMRIYVYIYIDLYLYIHIYIYLYHIIVNRESVVPDFFQNFFEQISGEMVRNYVGGLEALVHLLDSSDLDVRSAVAYAIGCIAKNSDNLAIMSDHAVVRYLARLAPTVSFAYLNNTGPF